MLNSYCYHLTPCHDGNATNSFLFTGEQRDEETQDYYLRARYYSPNSSRFLGRDSYDGTANSPVTQNHYLYAGSNPMMYVDPSGHFFGGMMSLSSGMEIMGILAGGGAIISLGILNNNRSGYGGNIWLTVGIYNAQTFLRAELLPTFWLIGKVLTWQEVKLKNSRYDYNKPRCDRNPKREDYNSDCAYFAAIIKQTESCIRAYESWDNEYKPGEHADKIRKWYKRVKNYKRNYQRSCSGVR